MPRLFLIILFSISFSLQASVPEPSLIIYGEVQSFGVKVEQEGLLVSASYEGATIAEQLLTEGNDFLFSLEVLLEADVGTREPGKVRINDVVELYVAGQLVANALVDERGAYQQITLDLPEDFDSDGDGLLDSQEILNGSDPYDPNDPVLFGAHDLDGDGISNGAEFLTDTYQPGGDADGDGYSNQDEYTLSSDPSLASQMPEQIPSSGVYSALHVHDDVKQILLMDTGTDTEEYVWDEALNGVPITIVPVYWNVDKDIDYLISTSQGKLFVLLQSSPNTFLAPELISLFALPTGADLYVGFADIDGINAPELWAYSRVSEELYLYERDPEGAPYGAQVWLQVPLPGVSGYVQLKDLDEDGVVDVVASGVDLSIQDRTASNTIAVFKGVWDGINYSLSQAALVTSQTHIEDSGFVLLNNIGEAGFDKNRDISVRGSDQKYYIDVSFNGLSKGAIAESLTQQVIATQLASEGDALSSLLTQLNTGAANDAYAMADLDADVDNTMDLLQYVGDLKKGSGSLSPNAYKFRIVPGVISTRDQDLDGVADFKDIDAADPDKPLPNGDQDFDGDGIPYGIDGNHSGQEDSDGDGMTDEFELVYGLDPMDPTDSASDIDNDGFTALQEFLDGTDPADASSFLSQLAILKTSTQVFDAGASDLLISGAEVIVSSQNDAAVKLIDMNDLTRLRTVQSSDENGVSKLVVVNELLVLGNVGGSIEVFDKASGARLIKFAQSTSSVTDMSVSGNSLFSLHANGDVYHWNIETLVYVSHWHVYDGFLTNVYAQGELIYLQSSVPEKMMFVWNTRTQEQIYTIIGGAECCEKVVTEYSADTMLAVNSFSDSGIYAMNLGNFNGQEVVEGVDATAIRILKGGSVGGEEIYVGRKSGVIDWYSMEDGEFLGRVAAPYAYVRDLELVDGGFVSLHSDGYVYFWEHQ